MKLNTADKLLAISYIGLYLHHQETKPGCSLLNFVESCADNFSEENWDCFDSLNGQSRHQLLNFCSQVLSEIS
ncbi:hypothetical protein [Kamptonema sp. UHCC 0994]|uniref:hypothetical protein n=1 Tax=Kamptonema sp. UHCC 0994 TaxID=3031329 RepID=UPI0023BA1598|nr:hypothetical protein [Kamptonema sp. UHCC 0994]MDF0553116.1 hypothetical protein [Kamptonema sp. UHCC 0994]